MQIVTLQTKDFKGLPNGVYNFTNTNIITGRNGSGKSSLAEAVVFALYGRTRTGNASTSDLIHESAESCLVAVQFDTGTVVLREESRFYGSKIQLNGDIKDQGTLDNALPEYKTFLSVFMPGYFMAQDEADQRNELLKYGEKVDLSKLFADYTRKPNLLEKYLIDFSNLDKEYKTYRKMKVDLTGLITANEQRSRYATEQMAGLKKPKKRIDITKVQAQLDATIEIKQYQEILSENEAIDKQIEVIKGGTCPDCKQTLPRDTIKSKIESLEGRKRPTPTKPTGKPGDQDELQKQLYEANTVNALFDNYEEQILDLQKTQSDAEDTVRTSKERLADVELVVEALSPKGIRASAARRQMAPIVSVLNKHAGDSMPIKIETLEQLKTKSDMKEVFKLYANEIPYKFLSTGEKKRVDIAISQTINELSEADVDMYFVDDAELISESFTLSGQVYKAYVASEQLTIKEG